jgi:hypothetical protein
LIIAALGLQLTAPPPAGGVEGWWITYLSSNDIREVAITDEGVWCATGGGALFYDFARSDFRLWNRAENGLASDTLTSVVVFPDGKIAFGTAGMGISLYEPVLGLWYTYTSLTWPLADDAIRFIHEEPPWRIIGSDGGFVALLDEEVHTPCTEGLDLCGLPGWDLSAGIHYDNALWLGALPEEGAFGGVGRFQFPDESKARDTEARWDTLNTGLPSRNVTDFAAWEESLFCATTDGVVLWSGEAWVGRSEGLPEALQPCGFHAGAGRLLMAASGDSGGVFEWQPTVARWQRLGSAILQAHCVVEGSDGVVWAGMSAEKSGRDWLEAYEDGLWEFVAGQWIQHRRDGPHPVASYRALTVDAAGRIWAAAQGPGRGWRIVRFDESGWSFLDWSNSLTNAWVFDIRVESDRVWIGHCCCDAAEDCPFDVFSPGSGSAGTVDSVLNVYDSAVDSRGNLWFASRHERYESSARGVFHWERASGDWTNFNMENTSGLIVSDNVSAVVTEGEHLWIGYEGAGLSVGRLGDDGLPVMESAAWAHYTADFEDTLASNRVTALAARPGEVWVGTDAGVSLWENGVWRVFRPSPYGLPGGNVSDICLTDDGAAWVGAWGEGVTRISRDVIGGFVFEQFGPPDLVSPNVWVVATGVAGRDVWVGTDHGLAHFVPSAAISADAPAEVHVFPNPFNPACGELLRFARLPGQANSGLIVDVSGRVVQRFTGKWEGEVVWDGRDLDGEAVSPGLYIIRVATPRGWLTGRVALLDLPCDGW